MAAPARYLAEQARINANDYTDAEIEKLEQRLTDLEELVEALQRKLENA